MTINPADVLKITFEMTYPDGSICQNGYYMKLISSSGITDAVCIGLIEDWLEDCYTEIDDFIQSGMTIQPCNVDLIEWDTDKWVISRNVGYANPTVTFTPVDELLPRQCSAFFLGKTDRPKSNGRKFIAGFTEASTVTSFLSAAALTAMAAYAAEVIAGEYVDPFLRLAAGIVREAANEWLEYQSAVVTDTMFTQRRRVRGVGV